MYLVARTWWGTNEHVAMLYIPECARRIKPSGQSKLQGNDDRIARERDRRGLLPVMTLMPGVRARPVCDGWSQVL